jgi:hypothetical protein
MEENFFDVSLFKLYYKGAASFKTVCNYSDSGTCNSPSS